MKGKVKGWRAGRGMVTCRESADMRTSYEALLHREGYDSEDSREGVCGSPRPRLLTCSECLVVVPLCTVILVSSRSLRDGV